ncbi:MAG: PepSY domain-containing protein [Rhodothalassiaceae bacterium]
MKDMTVALLLALAAALLPAVASAAPVIELQRPDQDRARREVLEGRIMSYAEIARAARRAVPGRIVGQDLVRRGRDRYVYRLSIMQKGGKVAAVVIDARTGRILSVKGKR